MSDNLTFSIVVPTYNRPAQIEVCLAALAGLDYPRDCYEVIVVDDGGQISPRQAVERVMNKLNVRLVRQDNAGPSAARNLGAAMAKNDFLAFTDDDCAPRPDWLMRLAAALGRFPGALIGGQCINALPRNPFSTASQMLLDVAHEQFNRDFEDAWFFPSDNIAMSQRNFLEVNGFDMAFRYAEDRDFCDRWRARGWKLVYAGNALVDHAHQMGLKGFWKQHFGYGRGALDYHKARAQRKTGRLEIDWDFYFKVLTRPFKTDPLPRALLLCGLLAMTQVAVAAGMSVRGLSRPRQMAQNGQALRPPAG